MARPIDRRQFLAGAVGVGAASVVHSHVGRSLSSIRAERSITPQASSSSSNRILVLLTLYGGNDGLDTVVPYTDPAYYQQRGPIAIAQSAVLPMSGGFGFHPALTGMKALWDSGQLAVIRGVGYPDPNYSHFASMDIWQSGNPSGELPTGWLGRWLDRSGADPLRALWLGSNIPLVLVGEKQQASSIAANPAASAQLPIGGAQLRTLYQALERAHGYDSRLERGVSYSATNMLAVSNEVSQVLAHAPSVAQNFAATAGGLGTELGVVAQLILSGMPTQVYGVSLNGFDSHAGELLSYSTLLKQLDSGVGGFFKSLQGSPAAANVVMLIYSEFGRRVASNASGGTDHGSGNVAFVAGSSVKGGFYGDQPGLTQLDSNGSLVVTTDFRSIYSTILDQVINIDSTSVLGAQFSGIPFI